MGNVDIIRALTLANIERDYVLAIHTKQYLNKELPLEYKNLTDYNDKIIRLGSVINFLVDCQNKAMRKGI